MYYSKYTNYVYANGVKLVLCGEQATPKEVARRMWRKRKNYTVEMLYDDEGNLSEIHYKMTAR